MSSPSDASSQETGLGLEDRDHNKLQPADSSAQQAQAVTPNLESPSSEEDSISFEQRSSSPDHFLFSLSSDSDDDNVRAMRAERRRVPWGCEGRPGSPVDQEEDIALGLETHLNIKCASKMATQGAHRYLSSERGAAAFSPTWVGAKLSPSRKMAAGRSRMNWQQDFISPFFPSWPNRDQCLRNMRSNNRSRFMVNRAAWWPPPRTYSNSRSLHQFNRIQPVRMNVSHKGRGQAKSSCPRESGDVAKHLNVHAQASVPHLQGTPVTFASRGVATNVEKQPSREQGASSSNKLQNMAWAKGEGGPSYPETGPVARGFSRATTWKEAQEKKSQRGGSRVILGRAFPLWGQNTGAAALEPATFPSVTDIQILGKSKTICLLPSRSKLSKQGATGKGSPAKKVGEPQPVAGEDKDPSSDSALQTKLSTHKPGPCSLSMHHREFIHAEADTRAPEVPAASKPLTVSQGGLLPRSFILAGDQEPAVQAPTLERQQPPTGAQGCPRCLVLQKEIDRLKEQLAVLQSFADKFQIP